MDWQRISFYDLGMRFCRLARLSITSEHIFDTNPANPGSEIIGVQVIDMIN